MIKKNKITLIILSITSTLAFSSDDFLVIINKDNNKFNEGEPYIEYVYDKWSSWENVDSAYNCNNWEPLENTVPSGVSFSQNGDCKQDQDSFRDVYKKTGGGEPTFFDTEYQYQTIDVAETQLATGTKNIRNMCIDILNKGNSTGDGIYTVDTDGDGSIAPKQAYCDMTNGGWTLYDSFGTHLVKTNSVNPIAYNYNSIKTIGDFGSAGYASYFSSLNSSAYHVTPYYIQWFEGGMTVGWIKKTMPSWVQSVKVEASNEWYGGTDTIRYGTDTRTVTPYLKHTEFVFNTGGELELYMDEVGILWLDSVWVK